MVTKYVIIHLGMCACPVTKSCLSLCDPMDCSPPGSSIQGTLQARTLEWVAMPSSRGSSPPMDQTRVSCIECGFFTSETSGSPHLGILRLQNPISAFCTLENHLNVNTHVLYWALWDAETQKSLSKLGWGAGKKKKRTPGEFLCDVKICQAASGP